MINARRSGRCARVVVLSESRQWVDCGKSVGKTEDEAEEPCHVDPDSGRGKFERRIVPNDGVLKGYRIGDADELLSYCHLGERYHDRIIQVG